MLLALDGRRSRLRLAVAAARKAGPDGPDTLRAVLRSLRAKGLIHRAGWRRHKPTSPAFVQLQHRVGATFWSPKAASARDADLTALLLASGQLSGRQRRLARSLMAGLPVDGIPPATTWLMQINAVDTTSALADTLIRQTPLPFHHEFHHEGGALDPGPPAGDGDSG